MPVYHCTNILVVNISHMCMSCVGECVIDIGVDLKLSILR